MSLYAATLENYIYFSKLHRILSCFFIVLLQNTCERFCKNNLFFSIIITSYGTCHPQSPESNAHWPSRLYFPLQLNYCLFSVVSSFNSCMMDKCISFFFSHLCKAHIIRAVITLLNTSLWYMQEDFSLCSLILFLDFDFLSCSLQLCRVVLNVYRSEKVKCEKSTYYTIVF